MNGNLNFKKKIKFSAGRVRCNDIYNI